MLDAFISEWPSAAVGDRRVSAHCHTDGSIYFVGYGFPLEVSKALLNESTRKRYSSDALKDQLEPLFVLATFSNDQPDYFLDVKMRCSACLPYFGQDHSPQPLLLLFCGALKTVVATIIAFLLIRQNQRFPRFIASFYANVLSILAGIRSDSYSNHFHQIVISHYAPRRMTEDELHLAIEHIVRVAVSPEFVDYFAANLTYNGTLIPNKEFAAENRDIVTSLVNLQKAFEAAREWDVQQHFKKEAKRNGNGRSPLRSSKSGRSLTGLSQGSGESASLLPIDRTTHHEPGTRDSSSSAIQRIESGNYSDFGDDGPSANRRRQLTDKHETLDSVLRTAKSTLRHYEELASEPILLDSYIVIHALTPQSWVLLINLIWCAIFLVLSFIDAASGAKQFRRVDYVGWRIYQAAYFRYLNSTASASLLVNSTVLSAFRRQPIAKNLFFRISCLLFLPALVTHCFAGFLIYIPILGPPLFLAVLLERTAKVAAEKYQSRRKVLLFLLIGVSRGVLVFVVAFVLSASFNYSATYLYNVDGDEINSDYFATVTRDYRARSLVCTAEVFQQSAATEMQTLGSVAGFF
jgi:hypothetical protein